MTPEGWTAQLDKVIADAKTAGFILTADGNAFEAAPKAVEPDVDEQVDNLPDETLVEPNETTFSPEMAAEMMRTQFDQQNAMMAAFMKKIA